MYNSALKTFLCVADCGSFHQAAERLYLSPTAVMKQMNLLEKHLGLLLLRRTSQGIYLTECGRSLYEDARNLIAYSEQAVARARKIAAGESRTLRIGTSMLNPCKIFMDLWSKISDRFPQLKIQVVPFEDDHTGILSGLDQIGKQIDFIVGVCDSAQWRSRCGFYPLGTYRKCVAVPRGHRLAEKTRLRVEDLHGETLMMVRRGDSPVNDRLRDDLERNHPQIRIEDTGSFYDISVYNRCEQTGHVLLNIECWKEIHPSLVTIPVDWEYTIPYGLLYPMEPAGEIAAVLEAISKQLPGTDASVPFGKRRI